jgi:hypothetical protein
VLGDEVLGGGEDKVIDAVGRLLEKDGEFRKSAGQMRRRERQPRPY